MFVNMQISYCNVTDNQICFGALFTYLPAKMMSNKVIHPKDSPSTLSKFPAKHLKIAENPGIKTFLYGP